MSDDAIPRHAGLVCAFVNTYDMEDHTDDISEPAALARWLAGNGLGETTPSPADLADAAALREQLRAALGRGGDAEPELGALTRRYPLRLAFTDAGPTLRPVDGGAAGALAWIVGAVARCGIDGSWTRLKVCSAHECRWAFYDSTRNRSRTWCAMRVCGNRQKTRTYRERRRGEP